MKPSQHLLLALAALALPAAVRAQTTAPAVRIDAEPVIDGALSEGAWSSLPVLGDFVQRIPQDGAPASLRTDVRVGYDDGAIYVGVRAFDDRP